MHFSALLLSAALPATVWTGPADKRAGSPTVTISHPAATIVGKSGDVEAFNAIPFAQPPTGQLRLKPPQAITSDLGTVDATGAAQSCPQFFFSTDPQDILTSIIGHTINIPLFQEISNAGEDCLSLNIFRPAGTTADSRLPVLFWIFGGGFELGSTAMYDGTSLVKDAIDMDMPFIFVAVNYRVGGFGFMPGKEILEDGSANLGLLDQRLGLQWVADNIAAFGGDPDKVTIWGESAGAISVFDQMALYDGDNTYNGKPLFRGGIMNSGSIVPAAPVDGEKGQAVYNAVVEDAGCSSADDTLNCLRELDYTTFLNSANSVPGLLSFHSVALSYLPRPDGKVLTDSPDSLVKAGKYADVPFIIGDQEDEGTIFALFQANLTTTDDLVNYFKTLFFYDASDQQLKDLVASYQTITEDGSPFRTGIFNNWYPQYKRLAAILGDLTFTLTRRAFLSVARQVKPDVKTWSYLASYDYGTPVLGSFHGGDILQVFYGILPNYASRSIHSYYFSFVQDLDPNSAGDYINWPEWEDDSRELMQFFNDRGGYLKDDFRSDTYDFLLENMEAFHI